MNPEVEAARDSNLYSATESGGFAWHPGRQGASPLLKKLLRKNRVGGKFEHHSNFPSSHTTGRTVPYPAVPKFHRLCCKYRVV